MHDKLANVVTELAEGTLLPDAQIKSITSGESMTAEHKFKDPFNFEPFSTLVFATNHLPHTRDFSEALFRRTIIIPFNRVFSEEEQDKHLARKLKTELPGILNLALTAMSGVFRRGCFTEPGSVNEHKKQWRIEADQAAQYLEECCEINSYDWESSDDMYQNYQRWVKQSGIGRALNKNNFIKRLKVLGLEPKKNRGERGVFGVKIVKQIVLDSDNKY